jgi:hypothetical protein
MSYIPMDFKGGAPRLPNASARPSKFSALRGLMPTSVFCKLFLSTLAAVLAVHFWRQRKK